MQKIKVFVLFFILFSAIFYVLDSKIERSISKTDQKSVVLSIPTDITLNEIDRSVQQTSKKYYEETLRRSRFNGAILVARNGKIVFEEYSGLKDVLSGDAIDSSTSFHLASVSKTFTAMSILKLFEQGSIQLEESVSH